MVVHSHNHRCYGNATVHYICIVADTHTAINNLKLQNIAIEMHEKGLFAVFSRYKIFWPDIIVWF